MIAYNKKIEPYIRSIGLLLPVEEDKLSIYDDSIVYTIKNVMKINENKKYYRFFTNHKYFKPEFKATEKELNKVLTELEVDKTEIFNFGTM